jgi:hypothetical protein
VPLFSFGERKTFVQRKLDNALIGAAGVHHVASELSLRGLIALPTIRNTCGVDLVAAAPTGTWHANVQVKTSQNKVRVFPLGKRFREFRGSDNYYVFVRWLSAESRFDMFLETADRVIKDTSRAIEAWRKKGNKEWTPCWPLPKDVASVEKLRKQWLDFGVDSK